jgi:hypothetical protein
MLAGACEKKTRRDSLRAIERIGFLDTYVQDYPLAESN